MGKGYNNYMTKKFFHPGSKENIKRVWQAEENTRHNKQKQEELTAQYQREQETLENRALLGDEKAKVGLSFMYDAPPGAKQALEKEDDEPEYKFEWQRKFNAPRESYAKDNEEIRDQPFGIEVRNVRCIKCHKWGHVNTDRVCPLFGKNITAEPPQPGTAPTSLMESMKTDGLQIKESIVGRRVNLQNPNDQIVESDDEEDPEVKFLKSLTTKQKKKLLKKLDKLQRKGEKSSGKKKPKKDKKSHKKRRSNSSSDSESDQEEPSSSQTSRMESSKSRRSHESGRHTSTDDKPRAVVRPIVKQEKFSPQLSTAHHHNRGQRDRSPTGRREGHSRSLSDIRDRRRYGPGSESEEKDQSRVSKTSQSSRTTPKQLQSPDGRVTRDSNRRRSRSPVSNSKRSPVNRNNRSPARRSGPPDNRRTPSPNRRRSRSPARRRSRSPARRRSRSPVSRGTQSPVRRRSRSPVRRRSRSPARRRSRSPVKRSMSPIRKRSRSPARRRSKSPIRKRSRSPVQSPVRRRSRSPARRRSRSPARRKVRSSEEVRRQCRSPSGSPPRSKKPIHASDSPGRSDIKSKRHPVKKARSSSSSSSGSSSSSASESSRSPSPPKRQEKDKRKSAGSNRPDRSARDRPRRYSDSD